MSGSQQPGVRRVTGENTGFKSAANLLTSGLRPLIAGEEGA
jgi:hypothetical protein